MKRKVLGKGLSALISERPHEGQDRIQYLNLDDIEPAPNQPRRTFDTNSITELADSIKSQGVILPVVVRPMGSKYQLIAGERRWRATERAGLKTIPAIVKQVSNEIALEIALIENLQRKDLNPLESAMGYKLLMEEYGLTQDQLSSKIGKDRATIANTIRLLKLPDPIKLMLQNELLSAGHAKALLALKSEKKQIQFADLTVKNHWSVRQLEKKIRSINEKPEPQNRISEMDPIWESAIEALRNRFATKIQLKTKKNGSGCILLDYYSEEDLLRIMELLGGN